MKLFCNVKVLITVVFIAALTYAGVDQCRSFYKPSNTTTHPVLSLPDAVVYDIQSIGNSWENPFVPKDPRSFQTTTYGAFTITRLRENPKTGQLPENVVNENYLYNTGLQTSRALLFLTRENRQSLGQIYANYAKQGPERSENIKTYQQEDIDYRDRTTHFLIQKNLETVGRIQLQHSLDPSQKLNVETHFPGIASTAIRAGSEKVFLELGRLHIPHPEKDGKGLSTSFERQLTFLELFLRPFMFVSKQAPAAAIVFQTNAHVLDTIRNRFAPYDLKDVTLISNPGEPPEYLTVIRASEVQKLTRVLFLKRFQLVLNKFAESKMGEFRFTIHPDEKAYYEELQVHQLTMAWTQRNYEPVWRNNFHNALGPLRNSNIKINVTFGFDTSIFINPHFISLGPPEAATLLERIQGRMSEFSQ